MFYVEFPAESRKVIFDFLARHPVAKSMGTTAG
jgi:hypothetical protein